MKKFVVLVALLFTVAVFALQCGPVGNGWDNITDCGCRARTVNMLVAILYHMLTDLYSTALFLIEI